MRIQHFNRRRPRMQRSLWHRLTLKQKIIYACGGFFGLLFLYAWLWLPSVDDAAQLIFAESTIIYDRGALEETNDPNDHILYVIHGDENREFIPLEEISPWIKKATIAIEDDNFYAWYHWGFDVGGITKGALNYFFGIGERRGGSTITQQLVKNTFLSRERTVVRKFNELLLAIKMELFYSKDEILEMYLNKIPYGHNAHGIEAAAKTFFGKSARDLSLPESAVLASLPVAPTRFSPYGPNKRLLMGWDECAGVSTSEEKTETEKSAENNTDCEHKKGRKDLVLQRLLDTKEISEDEFNIAWTKSKQLEFTKNRTDIKAPHFVFYVRQQLEEKYGKEFLRDGGLRIYTTLDPDLQALAEETIAVKTALHEREHEATNAALLAVDTTNGQILSYVGGKNYFDEENDGQFDVLTARRQPGSSFKPLVYTTAFENGYSPSTLLFDTETDFGGNYQPQNFDGEFMGPVTARESLNRSLNIPAIKMAFLATPKQIFENAEKIGVKIEGTPDQHGVAIGIGVAEVEPLSHINSFQVFAGDGSYFEPSSILEIRNSNGKTLEKFDPARTKKEGLDAQIVGLTRHILTDESTRPTTDDFDWNNLLQIGKYDNGAKTGTSNRRLENPDFNEDFPEDEEKNPKIITAPGDAWTIGFTPHLVVGAWVGNNEGQAMRPGATGMRMAAPIFRKFMADGHGILLEKFIEKNPDSKAEEFTEKDYGETDLVAKKINKYTGKIATEKTAPKFAVDEVFPSFSVPIELDDFGDLSDKQKKDLFTSIRSDLAHWQNPVTAWLDENPEFYRSIGVAVSGSRDFLNNYESLWQRYRRGLGNQSSGGSSTQSFRLLSPQKNQRIPINSLFEAVVLPLNPEKKIEKVLFFLNKSPIGQKNSPPYNALISTNSRSASVSEFTAQIWSTDGEVEEASTTLYLERERILQNQNPLIGAVNQNPEVVQVEIVSGSRKAIDHIRLVATQRADILYDRTLKNPPKNVQLAMPKTTKGFVEVRLYTKFAGEDEELTSEKKVRF